MRDVRGSCTKKARIPSSECIGLQKIRVISPFLYHLSPLRQVSRAIEDPPERITYHVSRLVLEEVRTNAEHFFQKSSRHGPKAVHPHPVRLWVYASNIRQRQALGQEYSKKRGRSLWDDGQEVRKKDRQDPEKRGQMSWREGLWVCGVIALGFGQRSHVSRWIRSLLD